MATPTRTNKKTWLGTEGIPTEDGEDIGGAPDAIVNPATVGNLNGDMRIQDGADVETYFIFYEGFNHTDDGSVENARVGVRSSARFNTSAGTVALVSTSASDTGVVRVVGKVSDVWVQEDITLAGTTPVSGIQNFDEGEVYRWEYLSGYPTGQITGSIASEVCAVIWGTSANPTDGGTSIATYMATTEIKIAIATAKNTTLTSTSRTEPPTGIGDFDLAYVWTGEDNTFPVPSGVFEVDDQLGVCGQFTAYSGIFPPSSGKIQFMHGVIGDATA